MSDFDEQRCLYNIAYDSDIPAIVAIREELIAIARIAVGDILAKEREKVVERREFAKRDPIVRFWYYAAIFVFLMSCVLEVMIVLLPNVFDWRLSILCGICTAWSSMIFLDLRQYR